MTDHTEYGARLTIRAIAAALKAQHAPPLIARPLKLRRVG